MSFLSRHQRGAPHCRPHFGIHLVTAKCLKVCVCDLLYEEYVFLAVGGSALALPPFSLRLVLLCSGSQSLTRPSYPNEAVCHVSSVYSFSDSMILSFVRLFPISLYLHFSFVWGCFVLPQSAFSLQFWWTNHLPSRSLTSVYLPPFPVPPMSPFSSIVLWWVHGLRLTFRFGVYIVRPVLQQSIASPASRRAPVRWVVASPMTSWLASAHRSSPSSCSVVTCVDCLSSMRPASPSPPVALRHGHPGLRVVLPPPFVPRRPSSDSFPTCRNVRPWCCGLFGRRNSHFFHRLEHTWYKCPVSSQP
jgi:hypothetical protein